MSYLFPDATATQLGVVQVGSNIDVDANSVISIPQSVATSASVTFGNVTDSALTAGRITFAGTAGLLTDDGDLTYDPVTNTLSVVNLNASGTLKLNGNSVVTSVTPTAGTGISLTSVTTSGPSAAFTVNNTGVTKIVAGTNVTISPAGGTGDVTINAQEMVGNYGADDKIERIVAKKNVTIVKAPDMRATSQAAVYQAKTGSVTLTENPHLFQGGNDLAADKITIDLNTNKSSAEGQVRMKVIKGSDKVGG